jgi:CRP-like cAMP-binding protein
MPLDEAEFDRLFGAALGRFPRSERSQLLSALVPVKYAGGSTLITEHADNDRLFLIVSGQVDIITEAEGDATTVGHYGPGGVFGEVGLLDPGPATATVRASEDVSLLSLSHDGLDALWERHPDAASDVLQALLVTMSTRVRHIEGDLDRTSSEPGLVARLLHALAGRSRHA